MLFDGSGASAVTFEGTERLFCPAGSAKLMARLRARSLDRALIDGADPAESTLLAAHARRLASPRTREDLADALERLARLDTRRKFAVFPHPCAVGANTAGLKELAARLRDPAPVYSAGVARLRRLVSDGTGAMYADRNGEWLRRELAEAGSALAG